MLFQHIKMVELSKEALILRIPEGIQVLAKCRLKGHQEEAKLSTLIQQECKVLCRLK